MADMKMLKFSLVVWMLLSLCEAILVDNVNKKIVNAVCFKDNRIQTMTLDFYLSYNGNQVDRVMALTGDTYENTNGNTNEASCDRTEDPSRSTHIRSTVSLSGTNAIGSCGARRSVNTNRFLWVIEVRALFNEGVYVGIDRRYFITCDYDDSISNFVTAQIGVIAEDSTGTSERLRPVNSMSVLGQRGTNGAFLSTEYVAIGQNVKLQIRSRVKSQSSSLEPYGVYPFSCDFGPLDRTNRTTFILQNGCPPTGNLFNLVNGFRFTKFTQIVQNTVNQLFETETDTFIMAIPPAYPSNNFYYISCYVNPCFGVPGSDSKCSNFCGASNGRRKRQDVNTADLSKISIGIRILDDETAPPVETPTDDKNEAQGSSERLAIIVAVSVSTVTFVFIVLVVIVLVCCRPGCCSGNQDDRLWESSTTASMSTKKPGSMDYTPPSLIQPKY